MSCNGNITATGLIVSGAAALVTGITKTHVGLSNVDNVSDANKHFPAHKWQLLI